jgi:hypothetical protein
MPAGVGEGVWQRKCGSEVREEQMKQPCCVSGSNAQLAKRAAGDCNHGTSPRNAAANSKT